MSGCCGDRSLSLHYRSLNRIDTLIGSFTETNRLFEHWLGLDGEQVPRGYDLLHYFAVPVFVE